MLLSNPDSEDLRRVTEEVPEDLRLPSDPKAACRRIAAQGEPLWKTTRSAEKSFANGWPFRRTSDRPKNRWRHSPKRRYSKTSSIAVGATRIRNFGATLSRRSWDGCCRARQVVTGRNSGVRHHVQCCAEEEVGRPNMAGQDALAHAVFNAADRPRYAACLGQNCTVEEADSTCG